MISIWITKTSITIFKDEFRIYNIREARFPNAALNSFISYVAYLNSESEEMIDNELNYDIKDNTEVYKQKIKRLSK